jgi:SpoVK/Ycf46/Vps4 family AAA+-type ATPase
LIEELSRAAAKQEVPVPQASTGFGHLRVVASGGEALVEEDAPKITFADVGGMEDVKAILERSFLLPLKKPELFQKFNKRVGGGLVLYGPPGCGKTFLARAIAGEIGARFVNVGLADVLDMWFGESEKRLHELFENARRTAPTVIFFDEVDALGQRRAQLKGAAGRTLVNQLLSELDGFGGKNEGVFVLGATNHPWDLDPALRRPGRFDRLLFVPPPNAEARRVILRLKLGDKPGGDTVELTGIAKTSEGFSGADLEAIVERATEMAIEASLKNDRETPIDKSMLERALKEARPSTRPWFETARNYAIYANEGGVYDELLAHLKKIGLG